MEERVTNKASQKLPWWTWVLPFFIFYGASELSLIISVNDTAQLIFLPLSFGIILIHCWGPRVLAGLFLSSIITMPSLHWSGDPGQWLILATHTTVSAAVSYVVFRKVFNGKVWLPDIDHVLRFTFSGIVLPVSTNGLFAAIYHLLGNKLDWNHILMIWTADFATCFAVVLPALYYLVPLLEKKTLIIHPGSETGEGNSITALLKQLPELALIFSAWLTISVTLPQNHFWFIYGIFTVLTGVRFGFGYSLLANLLVFVVTYLRPVFLEPESAAMWTAEANLTNIHFGMGMLSITACITGRVVSDLRRTERKLQKQFGELQKAHRELDQFVYSASHDLSAPLKSLLGLINISRYEKEPVRFSIYLDKMESSVVRLDTFISEILAYSKNARTEMRCEQIDLKALVIEVIDNFRFLENFNEVVISTHNVVHNAYGDRTRMKIILNNLISNALKYQRFDNGHTPYIRIWSARNHRDVQIHIEDNGAGIPQSVQKHIFKMFYRGTVSSTGSGLGLYIAKEAAEKIGGDITFNSTPGRGTTFSLTIPVHS